MEKYLKVKSDISLVRDMDSYAIVNQNKSEFDKFMDLSRKKQEEKMKFTATEFWEILCDQEITQILENS